MALTGRINQSKKLIMKFIYVLAFLLSAAFVMQAQTKEDSLAIEKAAKDYLEGWQSANVERVEKAVSPELAKRKIFVNPEGHAFVTDMGASLLIEATNGNRNGVRMQDVLPGEDFKAEVFILDISGTSASVKTTAKKYGFMDYLHLAKCGNEWKIINVLWDYLPRD